MRTDGAPPLSVSLLPVWPTRIDTATSDTPENKGSESRDDQDRRRREAAAERRTLQTHQLIPGHLRIELDEAAGCFVQTLTDPNTHEVLRRFPHESQLAFSRAVRAYLIAQTTNR
jgi:uncharacterized FlaG/YvyC family protein